MDSVGFWNVRGLNEACRQLDVSSFLFKNKKILVGLMETRVRVPNKDKGLKAFSGWNMTDNYAHAVNGRMWVLWQQSKCSVRVVRSSNQLIHCQDRKSVV